MTNTYICSDCKEHCDPVAVDNGFPYEYGSIKAFHHINDVESNCCGANLYDEAGHIVNFNDIDWREI